MEWFKDLKVLDLSSVLAGPLTSSFFSEQGAQVIKVENALNNGDVTRSWKLKQEDPESDISSYYLSANYNKQVEFLDFRVQEDLDKLYDLIENSDIVITNFRPHSEQKYGISYPQLKQLNPRIIHARVLSYTENPERPAYDVILQAESGYISMTGSDEEHLAKLPVAFIDVLASHQLRQGILCALLDQARDKKARLVEVSLMDVALTSLVNQASAYLNASVIAKPIGTAHPNIAPYGDLFRTKDQELILFAIGSDAHWQRLCDLLGKPKLSALFTNNHDRVKRRDELKAELSPLIKEWNSSVLLKECHLNNIPVAKVSNIADALSTSQAKNLTLEDQLGKRMTTSCFRISL